LQWLFATTHRHGRLRLSLPPRRVPIIQRKL
jgi:hypothetical protein